jgi:hypothetical protein
MKTWMPALLLISACSSSPTAAELCDGSDGTRLAVSIYGGMMDTTTEFLQPWGYTWLQVDGACQWFAGSDRGTLGQWTPVSTGTLTEAQAQDLLDDLQVGDWDRLAATADTQPPPDGPTFTFHYDGAGWNRAGDLGQMDAVVDTLFETVDTLVAGGSELVADQVVVQVIADDGGWVPEAWETTAPEADLASIAEEATPYTAEGAVRAGAAADPWRAMLADFLDSGRPDREVPRAEQDEQGWFLLVREDPDLLTGAELYELATR